MDGVTGGKGGWGGREGIRVGSDGVAASSARVPERRPRRERLRRPRRRRCGSAADPARLKARPGQGRMALAAATMTSEEGGAGIRRGEPPRC